MSKFQQRHYEAIASMFQEVRELAEFDLEREVGVAAVQRAMSRMFTEDNSLFMPDRFLRACQPGANVKARTK